MCVCRRPYPRLRISSPRARPPRPRPHRLPSGGESPPSRAGLREGTQRSLATVRSAASQRLGHSRLETTQSRQPSWHHKARSGFAQAPSARLAPPSDLVQHPPQVGAFQPDDAVLPAGHQPPHALYGPPPHPTRLPPHGHNQRRTSSHPDFGPVGALVSLSLCSGAQQPSSGELGVPAVATAGAPVTCVAAGALSHRRPSRRQPKAEAPKRPPNRAAAPLGPAPNPTPPIFPSLDPCRDSSPAPRRRSRRRLPPSTAPWQ